MLSIEDNGINALTRRLNNRTLEEEIPQLQILSAQLAPSSEQSQASSLVPQDLAICDLCLQSFRIRGVTKHRNDCLKKI